MSKIKVFKAGKHISANGQAYEFSESDLKEIADSYSPTVHEAPLVLGHPKDDAPAQGWVAKVQFHEAQGAEPAYLTIEPRQVDPSFAESVNAGRYKKRSIALYSKTNPANPTPGQLYLKHVGYLGAVAPAVKGLPDHEFAEDSEAIVFSEDTTQGASVLAQLREWLVAKFSEGEVAQILPEWTAAPAEAKAPQADPAFAEKQAELDKKARELAEREANLAHAELVAFTETLVKEARIKPDHKDKVVAVLSSLSKDNTAVEFSEGQSDTPAALLKAVLTSLPPFVQFNEVAPDGVPDEKTLEVQFQEAPGTVVDPSGLAVLAKAQAYQKQHPGVSFMEAVKATTTN